ncbi:MAG: EAL domain-containing protein, partial [Cyanobacteria bacterium J06600_6]
SATMVIWVAHNITQRKEMEQTLYAEKELAQVTLKSIGDAVITTNAVGQVKFVNPAAEQLTGWHTAEAQGKPLTEIFQIIDHFTREPVVNPVDVVLKTNQNYELANNTVLIARNEAEYAIEDSAAPIQDHQGKLIGAVIVFRDVTESRSLAHELSWQASHDALTGLYNRRKFEKFVEIAIKETQEQEIQHALCYLDLDRFKIINDTCGHAAGDELLKQITVHLKKRIRAVDIFARLGGDEFGLLLNQCPPEKALELAEQLRQLVQDFNFTWSDKVFKIGVSVGLVPIMPTVTNLASLLNTADLACYAAKKKGRNCVYLYDEQDAALAQQRGQRQWITKINQALLESFHLDESLGEKLVKESHRFSLHAQKIIGLRKSGEYHYEILLRLIDESGEIIAPGAFLPAAERYELMPAIDRWVVNAFFANYEAYCQSNQKHDSQTFDNLFAINLSGASINDSEFGTFLQAQFERYAIPPETICFEITETVAISSLDNAVTLIEKLKKIGCAIALDDFGSGMCSLGYLKNLPVDYLKIDGSFIKNIASDPINYATVEFFHHISKMMGIKTIAEFVEDELVLKNLQDIGIDYAQGYGIEQPQPLAFDQTIYS